VPLRGRHGDDGDEGEQNGESHSLVGRAKPTLGLPSRRQRLP
jgi:hypothetical protein